MYNLSSNHNHIRAVNSRFKISEGLWQIPMSLFSLLTSLLMIFAKTVKQGRIFYFIIALILLFIFMDETGISALNQMWR